MDSLLAAAVAAMLAFTDPVGTPSPSTPPPTIPTAREMLLAPERRVRSTNPRLQTLLLEGARRSPTFASLVAALDGTNVIVYIETVLSLSKGTLGRITIVPIAGSHRYLRIQIRPDLTQHEAIALLGHELKHAVEVAQDASVRDDAGMIRLYERIGHSTGGDHVYDTAAAQNAGRQVRRELNDEAGAVDYLGNLSGLSVNSASTPSVFRK
jgi:hypothetical protein